MMISPEYFYEVNLKGKNEKEISSVICGLKNQIDHLKNTIEHPDYGKEEICRPSEATQIWCNRMYLERAIQALNDLGIEYVPSQAEVKAQRFQDNICSIERIIFEIGGFFNGHWRYTVTIDEEHIHYNAEHSLMEKPSNLPNTTDYPMSKSDFLEEIRNLHIGEWLHKYDTERFGYTILDGTQWSLDIEYSNGLKSLNYNGSNSYPYNFNKLRELFGIEDV